MKGIDFFEWFSIFELVVSGSLGGGMILLLVVFIIGIEMVLLGKI